MKKEKTQDIWVAEFEGHQIKVTNKGKAKLYIDGVEASKEKGLVHFKYTLTAPIPNTDYIVTAKLDANKDVLVDCEITVGKRIDVTFGKEDSKGIFTPYTEDEKNQMREELEAAIVISTIL